MEPHRKPNNVNGKALTLVFFPECFSQNCCIMNVTLLDEFKNPFWCVSSPLSMIPEKTAVCYDYDGEHFLIHYKDLDGQVKMELVWMEEEKQFFLVSLVIYVSVSKVNEHFDRDY